MSPCDWSSQVVCGIFGRDLVANFLWWSFTDLKIILVKRTVSTWKVDWLTLTRHLKTQKKMRVVKVCKQLKCASGCQPDQLFKKLLETLRRQTWIQFKSHNLNITTKDDFSSSPRAGKRHLEVSSATLESISPFFLYSMTLSFVKTKMKSLDWHDMMRGP